MSHYPTLDPLAALAGTDTDALASLLRELETEDDALRKLVEGIALQAGIAPIEFEPIATVDGEQAAKDEHVVRVVVHAHEQHEPALRALKALCDAHPEWSATVEV